MKLSIRYAKSNDAPMLSLLAKMLFYEKCENMFKDRNGLTKFLDTTFSMEKMKLHLSKNSNTFWLVNDGVFPIGYLELKAYSSSNQGSSDLKTMLQKIHLFEEYLNKGIRLKLLHQIILEAKILDADKVLLFALRTNVSEIQFYSQNNFVKVGECLKKMGQETFEFILMEKRLNG